MKEKAIIELGDELYAALLNRNVVEPPTSRFAGITVDDAYSVSEHILACRIAAGETLVGRKIGLTNRAVQKYFAVDQPDMGNLTDRMRFANGAEISINEHLIQPKVEGEVAFVLKRGLRGPGVTVTDVLEATDYLAPCFEIVDSRVRDWKIRIEDTVADNASSGLFVIGDDHADPRELDLGACEMEMMTDGEIVARGKGAAVLGSPLTSVAWLANALDAYGVGLRAGDVILSGSLGPVVPALPGTQMIVSITDIGNASVRFS
jgi:2-oxopent-4-enoate/cis-2-oxohex-4-enoate hydratase